MGGFFVTSASPAYPDTINKSHGMLDDERKGAREKNKTTTKKKPTKEQEDRGGVLGMIHKRHPT